MILTTLPISSTLIRVTPSMLVNYLYNTTAYIVEPIVILDIWLGLK